MNDKTCKNCHTNLCVFSGCKLPMKCKGTRWSRNPRLWLSILPTEDDFGNFSKIYMFWRRAKTSPWIILEIRILGPVCAFVKKEWTEVKTIGGEWQGPITPEGA